MKRKSFVDIILLLVMLAISLCVRAQEEGAKTFKIQKLVRDGNNYIAVKADFAYHKQYPELQKFISKRLFKEESTSVEEAFNNYLKTFDEISEPDIEKRTYGQSESFKIEYIGGPEEIYLNYFVGYTKKRLDGNGKDMVKKNLFRNFIYDIQKNKILSLTDVFKSDKVEEINAIVEKSTVQMMMDDKCIIIGYKKNGKQQEVKYNYNAYKEDFTDYFKHLIAMEEVDEAIVDVKPEFKGGMTAMIDYLSKQVEYPLTAMEKGIQGRVLVSFVVGRDGTISNVVASASDNQALVGTTLSAIRSMRKWNPGRKDGIPVKVKCTLPITFIIESDNDGDQSKKTMISLEDGTKIQIPLGKKVDEDKAFDVVEQMPSFIGGDAALMKYLNKNVKYPVIAEENGIQGRVVINFIVECDGSITNVKVTRSVDPSLDKEAARVIKSMPKWNPGKQNGSAVRVKFTLPVTFRLDNGKTAKKAPLRSN